MSEETKREVQIAESVKEEKKTPAADEKKEEKKVTANTKAGTAKAKTPATKEQKAEVSKSETKAATDSESNKATKTQSAEPDFMDHYRKAYPKEPCFHVTSDKQVFLSRDLSLAKRHQKTVDEKKEVETIER